MKRSKVLLWCAFFSILGAGIIAGPKEVFAHCDTLDGPVIKDAKTALEKGNVTPVLKWVKKECEEEIRSLFTKTLVARKKDPQIKELVDMYFFETLVRIHRAGEGAPYTGLKPAGTVEPPVAEADKAIASGSVDGLAKKLSKLVSEGIHDRFKRVIETKKHVNDSVEAGREYVEAYVAFVHYVERIHLDALGSSSSHGQSKTAEEGQHKH